MSRVLYSSPLNKQAKIVVEPQYTKTKQAQSFLCPQLHVPGHDADSSNMLLRKDYMQMCLLLICVPHFLAQLGISPTPSPCTPLAYVILWLRCLLSVKLQTHK